MGKREIEEKHVDVLHNIETSIVVIYRNEKTLTDWDVLRAVESLIDEYQAEKSGREPRKTVLKPLAEATRDLVHSTCEMTLGRLLTIVETEEKVLGIFKRKRYEGVPIEPKTVDELLLCLRRIRDSIQFWTKESGRQGYLQYIDQFIV
jgi:hypothetical protein